MGDPSFLFTQFLGGLTTAMFLFLIASGLSLVFGVLRVLNFAHGSFYMLGAYLAWQVVQWLTPLVESFWLAALLAALVVAVLGGLVERLLLRHMYGQDELYQLLFTYALVLILGDAAKAIWGTQQLSVSRPPILDGGIEIFGTVLPVYNLFIMLSGAVDRRRRLADPDAQLGRAHGAGGGARPRDAGRTRCQCRRALHRRCSWQAPSSPASPARWSRRSRASCRAWTSRSSSRRSSSS